MSEQPPLAAEIDRLKAELAAARKRIAELEKADNGDCCPSTVETWGGAGPDCTQQPSGIARLAAALEWYADSANYLKSVPGHWGEWQDAEPDGHRRKWMQDHGQRARQALGRE